MDKDLKLALFPTTWTPNDLREMRKSLQLTQAQVGDIFGVTKTTIKNLEKGITTDPMKLFAYATILERCYAYREGYLPAYRKVGTELIKDFK